VIATDLWNATAAQDCRLIATVCRVGRAHSKTARRRPQRRLPDQEHDSDHTRGNRRQHRPHGARSGRSIGILPHPAVATGAPDVCPT